ncbi:MAG TPA: hypothetical protein PLW60_01160 [Bacilli bacterium]|mgnify:CR=1 FL=1|nr:hypothetical protein [Bacilli bacterium]HQC74122.1 hypothetical protein [Bacilli bacterium]
MNISVNYFTKAQIKLLSNNQYVVKITKKAITYSKEFKNIFVCEYEKGLFPQLIFENMFSLMKCWGKKELKLQSIDG